MQRLDSRLLLYLGHNIICCCRSVRRRPPPRLLIILTLTFMRSDYHKAA